MNVCASVETTFSKPCGSNPMTSYRITNDMTCWYHITNAYVIELSIEVGPAHQGFEFDAWPIK